ncbi:MAG TPA: hypothetical protein DEF30_08300 [Proteiniclasticum sp.]|uniref:hypothetical protein n=1 Tax=Proteiniclasticum sp. TaxID=2053595 RepID=UPI000E9D182B|nr:hypothetical protein [Proteiniclasticum sp.]HBW13801.1 hypothetical protein [Proteiniclasticum sp.]
MTAKEELKQIHHLDCEIKFLLEQLEELYTSITRITPVLSDMPKSSGSNDKMSDGVSKMLELRKEINKRVDYLYDFKRNVIKTINRIENPAYRRILGIRYLKSKDNSFEDIALAIGYSYYRTVRMHGLALQEYELLKEGKTGQLFSC